MEFKKKRKKAVIEVYFKDFFLAFQIFAKNNNNKNVCLCNAKNREINLHDYSHKTIAIVDVVFEFSERREKLFLFVLVFMREIY